MNDDNLPPLPKPDAYRSHMDKREGLYVVETLQAYARAALAAQPAEPVATKQTFTRAEVIAAIEAERHACSLAVWMTLMDAIDPGADDLGLDGWMREAEQRIKNRSANDPEAAPQPPAQPPQAVELAEVMRRVRRLQGHAQEWVKWYSAVDVLMRNRLPSPPGGTERLLDDFDAAIRACPAPQPPQAGDDARDAERWRFFVANCEWRRHIPDDCREPAYSLMAIRLPYEADQSCIAMRNAAIDAAKGQ